MYNFYVRDLEMVKIYYIRVWLMLLELHLAADAILLVSDPLLYSWQNKKYKHLYFLSQLSSALGNIVNTYNKNPIIHFKVESIGKH